MKHVSFDYRHDHGRMIAHRRRTIITIEVMLERLSDTVNDAGQAGQDCMPVTMGYNQPVVKNTQAPIPLTNTITLMYRLVALSIVLLCGPCFRQIVFRRS